MTLFNAAAATGTSKIMTVADFKTVTLAVATANNASFTMKVQGSISTATPDFTASQSPSNMWTYIQVIDLTDQSVVNGATGIVASGTDINRMVEVNTNQIKWLAVTITAYSAGNITLIGMPGHPDA